MAVLRQKVVCRGSLAVPRSALEAQSCPSLVALPLRTVSTSAVDAHRRLTDLAPWP